MMGERRSCAPAKSQPCDPASNLEWHLIDTAGDVWRRPHRDARRQRPFRVSGTSLSRQQGLSGKMPRARACRGPASAAARLGTDYIDLYLLHWRGGVPFAETVETVPGSGRRGQDLQAGESATSTSKRWMSSSRRGARAARRTKCSYNLSQAWPRFDLIPGSPRHAMPLMAIARSNRGAFLVPGPLSEVAERHQARRHTRCPRIRDLGGQASSRSPRLRADGRRARGIIAPWPRSTLNRMPIFGLLTAISAASPRRKISLAMLRRACMSTSIVAAFFCPRCRTSACALIGTIPPRRRHGRHRSSRRKPDRPEEPASHAFRGFRRDATA